MSRSLKHFLTLKIISHTKSSHNTDNFFNAALSVQDGLFSDYNQAIMYISVLLVLFSNTIRTIGTEREDRWDSICPPLFLC